MGGKLINLYRTTELIKAVRWDGTEESKSAIFDLIKQCGFHHSKWDVKMVGNGIQITTPYLVPHVLMIGSYVCVKNESKEVIFLNEDKFKKHYEKIA